MLTEICQIVFDLWAKKWQKCKHFPIIYVTQSLIHKKKKSANSNNEVSIDSDRRRPVF